MGNKIMHAVAVARVEPANAAAQHTLSGSPRGGLCMATWGFFVGFAAVALYGPAAQAFHRAMHLSEFALGALVAAPQLTGSLLRIPFGAWADQVGGRKPMLMLLGASALGMAGVVAVLFVERDLPAALYPLILALGCLSGFGVATFAVGVPQVAYWYPKAAQAKVLGLYGGIGTAAPGVSTLVLPYAIASFGLARSYSAWLAVLIVGTAAYAIWARDAYFFQLRAQGAAPRDAERQAATRGAELFPRGSAWQSLGVAAREGRTWALVLMYFVAFGGSLALTAWLPTYWGEHHHVALRTAGVLVGAGFAILTALARAFGGTVAQRWGGERTAQGAFVAALLGAGLLTFSETLAIDVSGQLLLAIGLGVANAAVFALVPAYVPHAVGGAAGLVGGLGAFGGFVIPPMLGFAVNTLGARGFPDGFGVFIVLIVLALAVTTRLAQHAHATSR